MRNDGASALNSFRLLAVRSVSKWRPVSEWRFQNMIRQIGYRSCLGLLNLAKRFGRERLEAACQRALQLGSPSRRSVVSLLEQGLDQLPLPDTAPTQPLLIHENIRGPGYYQ